MISGAGPLFLECRALVLYCGKLTMKWVWRFCVRFHEHSFHSGFYATIHHSPQTFFQFKCRSKPTRAVFCEVIILYKKKDKNYFSLLFIENGYKGGNEVFWLYDLWHSKHASLLKLHFLAYSQASKFLGTRKKNQISIRIFFLFKCPPVPLTPFTTPSISFQIGSSCEFL